MRITFAGAAGTVTGSRYLVEGDGARVLVDCGLFQGIKRLRERNWSGLPFDVGRLDAVVLTHAHIDHSGYLPRLVKSGYRGPVFCTPGTRDLLGILLPDSGYLQEEEAKHANKYGYAHHRPALPLYTRAEAEDALKYLRPIAYDTEFTVAPGVQARFTRAGHILGSACVRLTVDGRVIGFSGDVGRPADPIMRAPDRLPDCEVLVVESTYGDRRHPEEDTGAKLATFVQRTVDRGGSVVIPAFAVGRAQHLLYLLSVLRQTNRIPNIPIYLDSPMAISATELFGRHAADHKLTRDECERMCSVASYTRTPDDSKAIDRSGEPAIIISASGMATGGRVLHHLRRFLPDERSTIVLVGHQAEGTRGRSLLDGTDELKIHGQYVRVRAQISTIESLSAHADYSEILAWLRASECAAKRIFVTHGETAAADAMRRRIRDAFGVTPQVPEHGEVFEL